MIVGRNNLKLLYLICLLCLIFAIIISSLLYKYIFNVDINPNQEQEENLRTLQEEFTITAQQIRIPTETELQDLEKISAEILNNFNDIEELLIEIELLYQEVRDSPVCSKANKNFNLLESHFYTFQERMSEIHEQISLFEEKYVFCLDLMSEIPEYSVLRNEMYDKFIKKYGSVYELVLTQSQQYFEAEEEAHAFYLEAQQIANDLFEEYFDLMCHIVYAEAGICPPIEQCYVANVIENRIACKNRFPNNLHDVVYSPGQYAPVTSGSINNTPSKEVIETVEAYLRGYIETEMPDDVFFQSRSVLGKIWKAMPSGHFFCY